jgi:lactoylglutathione lyase
MAVRALGVNHIAFEVHDLDQTLAWYRRHFVFELRGRHGNMAWIDLGDQFIALTEGGPGAPDRGRHVGLVVDEKEALRAELIAAGEDVPASGSLRIRDPSGNLLEIVDYRDVQFTKSAGVLRALGVGELEKSQAAHEELRAKGIADG